jgi:hypothetical protein
MEAVGSSEMLVPGHKTAVHYVPDEHDLMGYIFCFGTDDSSVALQRENHAFHHSFCSEGW